MDNNNKVKSVLQRLHVRSLLISLRTKDRNSNLYQSTLFGLSTKKEIVQESTRQPLLSKKIMLEYLIAKVLVQLYPHYRPCQRSCSTSQIIGKKCDVTKNTSITCTASISHTQIHSYLLFFILNINSPYVSYKLLNALPSRNFKAVRFNLNICFG